MKGKNIQQIAKPLFNSIPSDFFDNFDSIFEI